MFGFEWNSEDERKALIELGEERGEERGEQRGIIKANLKTLKTSCPHKTGHLRKL